MKVSKKDYVAIFMEILNPEGHQNCITGSKVRAILLNGGFCPLEELHREGSAPAACAAGLFLMALRFMKNAKVLFILFMMIWSGITKININT